MTPVVRPASAADEAMLATLDADAQAAARQFRGGDVLVAGLASPTPGAADRVRFVVTLDEHVVGFGRMDVASDVATVRQVYVVPEARELGCGELLVEAMVAHGRAAGCRRLDGIALPGDRSTKNLYERAAIIARAIIVSREL